MHYQSDTYYTFGNYFFFPLFISFQTAGLESPTHALRADADPSAQSASATYITLAQEHPYDRHIEIILHLSGNQHLKKKKSPYICHLDSLLCYFVTLFT